MSDLILPSTLAAIDHNEKALTKWGNSMAKKGFKAAVLIGSNEAREIEIEHVSQLSHKQLAALLRLMADGIDKM